MPFIPHTEQETQEMLHAIGAPSIEALWDEIPSTLTIPASALQDLPEGLCEQAVTRLLQAREPALLKGGNFVGAGAYEHFIPAAVWQVVGRGEFLTSYTPYQAEASQGTLQVIYEYQTMMARLMAMEVSNASLYDGASALVEAVLMALRLQQQSKRTCIEIPRALNPRYKEVLETVLAPLGFTLREFVEAPLQDPAESVAAVVIAQPNFWGSIEDADAWTLRAQQQGALVIALVNPMAMALLKPPGLWGDKGADIVCGEGQPFGVPLAGGGPYFGFLLSRQAFVRQMPGRIVGRTCDAQGREGFTLTLQAREQHIRRAKANSNICTNQGLLVTAATIYLSLLGGAGLRDVAERCHQNARLLQQKMATLQGVEVVQAKPFFHEFIVRVPGCARPLWQHLQTQGLYAGYLLGADYPEYDDALLLCVTETKTEADLQFFVERFSEALKACAHKTGANTLC